MLNNIRPFLGEHFHGIERENREAAPAQECEERREEEESRPELSIFGEESSGHFGDVLHEDSQRLLLLELRNLLVRQLAKFTINIVVNLHSLG